MGAAPVGNDNHQLYYELQENQVVLIIHSEKQLFSEFWEKLEASAELDEVKKKQVNQTWEYIRKILYELGPVDNDTKNEKAYHELLELNVKLTAALEPLFKKDDNFGTLLSSYGLEGKVGKYGSLPKPTGDLLELDHQPQASILTYSASYTSLFSKNSPMAKRAKNRAQDGYAIMLHHIRHAKGRTGGGYGSGTSKDFRDKVRDEIKLIDKDKRIPADQREQAKRNAIVEKIKEALLLDVDQINTMMEPSNVNDKAIWGDILGGWKSKSGGWKYDGLKGSGNTKQAKLKLINKIRKQILRGEQLIKNQPLDELKKP
jgi:hypothetical protein